MKSLHKEEVRHRRNREANRDLSKRVTQVWVTKDRAKDITMASNNKQPIYERLKPETTIKISYDGNTDSNDKPKYVLGYWSIRGLGAPVRMMLNAAGVNHWVMHYDAIYEKDGSFGLQSWLTDKQLVKDEGLCELMNLPFLVVCGEDGNSNDDDERVIAQNNAILMYLGRKHNMLGSNDIELSTCEMFLCELMDLRNNMTNYIYGSIGQSKTSEEDLKDATNVIKGGNRIFDKFELYLSNKKKKKTDSNASASSCCYLVGNKISAPDFHCYELIDQYIGLVQFYKLDEKKYCICDKEGSRFPNLYQFYIEFAKLPCNKAYIESKTTFNGLPYNNPFGRFGTIPGTNDITTPGTKDSEWNKLGVVIDKRAKN